MCSVTRDPKVMILHVIRPIRLGSAQLRSAACICKVFISIFVFIVGIVGIDIDMSKAFGFYNPIIVFDGYATSGCTLDHCWSLQPMRPGVVSRSGVGYVAIRRSVG
jgi:hypothetical protein